jgi:hypothetical protein
VRRRRRRLMRQDLTREIADAPQNRSLGTEGQQWEKPELGATEAQRQNVRKDRRTPTVLGDAVEIPNSSVSVPKLHDTGCNIVEAPGNPVHELYDTRHNVVEVPNNPVHELYDARRNVVEVRGNPVYELSNART